MVNIIADRFALNCETLAQTWLKKVRKAENLRTYNEMPDAELIGVNSKIYVKLSLWFQKEIDKNQIGAFFVDIGKERKKQGFSVSEVSFALLLSLRTVQEYLMNEDIGEGSMKMYLLMNMSSQVADFFFLGSYYMMKGYLEDTYLEIQKNECLPEERLKAYFRDDFFFKETGRG